MSDLPIVMLPGLLCDANLFAPQAKLLSERRQVMVADLSKDSSLPAMARRLLKQAPAQFNLLGLSMGGYLAFEIMRQAPHRVAGLALLGTSARPDTPESQRIRRQMIAWARKGKLALLQQEGYARSVHASRAQDTALRKVLMDMALDLGPECFERQQRAIMARPDSRPLLPAISCPVLVMVGDGDQITPTEYAREIAQAIPHATLHVLPQCGHISTLERPDEVNAVLTTWLSGSGQRL
ncbi:alpha/beta hydrolase [Pusillimonas sp. CC-YST705]|uniref:Alpha/beta hydrolase n=1 Tax=Mesopusillimonas faecipullorum TaxID=2755040 RepID=A0ABS8C954_9BURK|nr:alpha/beta hydrolase [Mesopusillimonas faecipullorum]MCB5362359.1 alpha/beta hydrolase [Mesopusillimonas faecipullorum]